MGCRTVVEFACEFKKMLSLDVLDSLGCEVSFNHRFAPLTMQAKAGLV